jgi:hypothetical protein
MHLQQGGERKVEKSCIASLEPIPRVKGELVHFFFIFGFWGVWSVVPNRSDRFWEPAEPVCAQSCHLFRGSMHMGRGALVCFGGLCSLLEHGFVSDVSSYCPCLRGLIFVFLLEFSF